MARRLRLEFEGAIHHVTARGVERRPIFRLDADRERFLERLADAVETHDVRLHLFCLMTNHVHLLAETPHANLGAFMHQLQTAYTVYFNLRHQRQGHLMQGRYGARPVQGDAYLLRLSRYLHLNPVFAGPIKNLSAGARRDHLRSYRWSSYRGYAGFDAPFAFVHEAPVLAMTEAPSSRRRAAYRRYVESGIAITDDEFLTLLADAHWGVGDSAFQSQMQDLHADRAAQSRRAEDVAFRRPAHRLTAADVCRAVADEFGIQEADLRSRQYNCAARPVAALLLGRHAGTTQREIAAILSMGTGASVCQGLRRLKSHLDDHPALRKQVADLSGKLASLAQRRV